MQDEKLLLLRFAGRTDDYARQRDGGRYARAGAPLTHDVLRAHLRGAATVAAYQCFVDAEGETQTRTGLLDFDTGDGLERAAAVWKALLARGVDCLLEMSRQGRAHLWLFFRDPQPAALVRRALRGAHALSGVEVDGVEVFPTSDRLSPDRWGNTTRLPLGLHRKCTPPTRFGFFDPLAGREVPRAWAAQLGRLAAVADTPPAALELLALHAPEPEPRPVTSPSVQPNGKSVTPTLRVGVIARLNAALLARYGSLAGVVSQFTDAPDARGWTRCPFHEDERPSLRVDERHCRAVCYVCAPQSQRLRFATFDAFEFVTQARFGGDKKVATHVLAEELFAPAAAQ